jgi:hypothetical protein
MATVMEKAERRDFSRIALKRPARVEADGAQAACELQDVSLRGALVRVSRTFAAPVGRPVTLVILLDHGAAAIRMRGTVAHRDDATLGLRCRDVDLEGLTHLRRILEVNLGEERLLHRELEALVASRSR